MAFICDKISILEKIKNLDPDERICDDFFTGLNFSIELDNLNLDLFGCWNLNCEDNL